jgi:hypothetical protein
MARTRRRGRPRVRRRGRAATTASATTRRHRAHGPRRVHGWLTYAKP